MGIAENLKSIRERIAKAALSAGRAADSVRLLAVSKTFPVEDVLTAYQAGQLIFGENKVQEGLMKAPLLPSEIEWHLIGPLQRNKVRKALSVFHWIHSVDSLKLAQYMEDVAAELGVRPKVLFEVHVGGEESKFGFEESELEDSWEAISQMKNLQPQGLMCIPPPVETPEAARPYFAQLRILRDRLRARGAHELPELSMGMSHDFEAAIQEGATMVRVGTSIFGGRSYSV